MMHLIQTPAGNFAFVGSVPAALAYKSSDPKYLEFAAHAGPGFALRAANREGGIFEAVVFPDRAEAWRAALEWAGSEAELVKHAMPALEDLQADAVSSELFLASRGEYKIQPRAVKDL